ncbi:MAG: hypothetical protein WC693_05435 [Patescibacteria group bacterium]|jgi:hypothetical protein
MISLPSKARTILLFVLIFLVYISSVRFLGTIDGAPTRMLPISILKEGDFDLDEYVPARQDDFVWFVLIETTDGHFISKYPVLSSILALPFYAIPHFLGIGFTTAIIITLSKISAAFITAISAILLLFIFRKYLSEKWSVFLTIAYAFGTSSWTVSSQDLWQHGASQLFLILTVYLLLKPKKSDLRFLLIGVVIGLSIAARYLNVIFGAVYLIFILYKYRTKIFSTLLGVLVPLSLVLIYQSYYLDNPFQTGYSCNAYSNRSFACIEGWYSEFWDGFGGLLISPSRGLFIFTPFLIFSLIGMWLIWKRNKKEVRDYNLLFKFTSIGVLIFVVVMSKWWAWYGGVTYGPRMLADITPLMMLFFIPLLRSELFKRKVVPAIFILLVVFSIINQFTGIIFWDGSWQKADTLSADHAWLWDWGNSQLIYYIKMFF